LHARVLLRLIELHTLIALVSEHHAALREVAEIVLFADVDGDFRRARVDDARKVAVCTEVAGREVVAVEYVFARKALVAPHVALRRLHTAEAALLLHTAEAALLLHTAEAALLLHTAEAVLLLHAAEAALLLHAAEAALLLHAAEAALLLHTAEAALLLHTAEAALLLHAAEAALLLHTVEAALLLHTVEAGHLRSVKRRRRLFFRFSAFGRFRAVEGRGLLSVEALLLGVLDGFLFDDVLFVEIFVHLSIAPKNFY